MSKSRVLFLCTGNAARSQMAEALVNHLWVHSWEAHSAGTVPAGQVHPMAVRALEEIGAPTDGLRSKSPEEFKDCQFDLVVTVCDSAAENCPVWLGRGRRVHAGFPDPAAAAGSCEERMQVFRQVREDIRSEVGAILERARG